MSNQGKLDASNFVPKSLKAREYGSYRAPRYDEVAQAVVVDDNATYQASVNATAQNETTVIATPGANLCIRVKTIMVNNVGANQTVVSLQEGTSGAEKFKNSMPQYGSMWNFNLIGAYWILAPNTSLEVNLGAIGDVNVEIGYDIVKAIPTLNLIDSQIITESAVNILTQA